LPFYLDALLDTGSVRSSIPAAVVTDSETQGLQTARGSVTAHTHRGREETPTYRFFITIWSAPKPVRGFQERELQLYLRKTKPLYAVVLKPRVGREKSGLAMACTNLPYALVGRDVLSEWTVIVHGRTQRFKVLRGSLSDWLICSAGPRLTSGCDKALPVLGVRK
jgi:hypothetical protein